MKGKEETLAETVACNAARLREALQGVLPLLENAMRDAIALGETIKGVCALKGVDYSRAEKVQAGLRNRMQAVEAALAAPPRNVDMYASRHEAFLAYGVLPRPPYWFEDDGVPAFVVVDFDEWLWLPVRENGKYTRVEKKKFLEGKSE